MALRTGTQLGPYVVTAFIGQGGMGAVYRARDERLRRDVALKILLPHLSADPDRLARFVREAQVLASLNHPNIAAIHGLEESDGVRALVMELVEGATLADRIAAGRIPVDEALPIARQMALALEAAHERGIIHRDLKPANVKLTSDGTVKVLDFGLAKALDDAGETAHGAANSPTITSPAMTQAGVLLGTAAYMAPEQARGQRVDRRADIWAFGVVLLEMLTGRSPFAADTITDVLAAIVKGDPDWTALPSDTPDAIRTLLRRCLQKNRQQRLQDIGDARIEIEEAIAAPASGPTARPASPRSAARWWLAIASAVTGSLVSGLVLWPLLSSRDEGQRTAIHLTARAPANGFLYGRPLISPDGTRLAFVARVDNRQSIWIRPLAVDAFQELPGTDEAVGLFWSPDSRALGFFARGVLKRIAVEGGSPQVVCPVPHGATVTIAQGPLLEPSGAWSRNGEILFGAPAVGLFRVPASGGTPAAVRTLDRSRGEQAQTVVQFLPDDRRFFFFIRATSPDSEGLYVGTLDGTGVRRVSGSRGIYAAGFFLSFQEEGVVAQPFDAVEGVVAEGAPRLLAPPGAFSASDTGVLAYLPSGGIRGRLTWFERSGREVGTLGEPNDYWTPRLSRNGQRLAVEYHPDGPGGDLLMFELASGESARFTFNQPGHSAFPIWSPDDAWIIFHKSAAGQQQLYRKVSSGAGPEDLIPDSTAAQATDWSRDGRFVLHGVNTSNTGLDLRVLPLATPAKVWDFAASPFNEIQGQFSPDGRFVAYASDELGRFEVFVRPFPDGLGRWQVSRTGGEAPRWRRDGRELFYVAGDGKLMAAPVQIDGGFRTTGTPKALFDPKLRPIVGTLRNAIQYDVTADGDRFITVTRGEEPPIHVLLNWPARIGR